MKSFTVFWLLCILAISNVFAQQDLNYYPHYTLSESEFEALAQYDVDSRGRVSAPIMSFHGNGAVKDKGFILAGKKHGTWLRFNSSGICIYEAHYRNGHKHGQWYVWDDAGLLKMRMSYEMDRRIGRWIIYDVAGEEQSSRLYR